jgi:hypothetical protein
MMTRQKFTAAFAHSDIDDIGFDSRNVTTMSRIFEGTREECDLAFDTFTEMAIAAGFPSSYRENFSRAKEADEAKDYLDYAIFERNHQ